MGFALFRLSSRVSNTWNHGILEPKEPWPLPTKRPKEGKALVLSVPGLVLGLGNVRYSLRGSSEPCEMGGNSFILQIGKLRLREMKVFIEELNPGLSGFSTMLSVLYLSG